MTNASSLEFDQSRLDSYLQEALPCAIGPLTIERIPGGQSNPTYFVSYPQLRLVLRKKPGGPLLPSAHAIDREYRIQEALAATAVPVPSMRLYCSDASVIGTEFYVMDRLEGRVFGDCGLPEATGLERRPMFLGMAETLARLHLVDWSALGLRDFGRAGDFYGRQIDRWTRQWTLSNAPPNADIARLQQWLPLNAPRETATAIVHGDFRIGNMLYRPDSPAIAGVLDWELCTLGDPLADLAYSALAWRLASDEYMGMRDKDLAALGIPTEQEYLAHYAVIAPQFGPCTPFHFAFALFRLAVIFEGIAARARAGTASGQNAASVGRLSARFARRACEALDGG